MALLEVDGLRKAFANGVRAVDGVDLEIEAGTTLGLVGESGCGKSTTARLLLRLLRPDDGEIRFGGRDITRARRAALRRVRADLQFVPQHPLTSLNPRLTIGQSLAFNLRAQRVPRAVRRDRIAELLDTVGLPAALAGRYPHQMSGGQLQRVAIARAVSTDPRLVVCDEAVSALDKSVQAQILNLLAGIQQRTGLAYLFISHDLAVVEHLSDRVAVMYLGRVVEEGPARDVWADPAHPYTRALLSATPGRNSRRAGLEGDPPSPVNLPVGCRFSTRCPDATDACRAVDPQLAPLAGRPGRRVACLHAATEPVTIAGRQAPHI